MEIKQNGAAEIPCNDCVSLWDDHQARGITKEYLAWRYLHCFGAKTRQTALYDKGHLIGQAIVFEQNLMMNGQLLRVAQLGDLIVHKAHRSIAAVRALYNGLRDVLHDGGYDFAFTLPNERSIILNRRFLKMSDGAPMQSRLCFHLPANRSKLPLCKKLTPDAASAIVSSLADGFEVCHNRIHWSREGLLARIGDPAHEFALVCTEKARVVVSKRKIMNIPVILVMATFQRGDAPLTRQDWTTMMGGAVSLFRTPFVVYTANSNQDDIGGRDLSKRVQRANKPVQFLNLESRSKITALPKLELIDTDVA